MDSAEKARAETFAPLVGISTRRVHQLVERGVLTRGATVGEWVKAYCANLAETQEKRAPEELRVARARLARAQAERYEMANERNRAELWPAHELPGLRAGQLACSFAILETIPGAVLQTAPHLVNDLGPLRLALEQIAAIVQPDLRGVKHGTHQSRKRTPDPTHKPSPSRSPEAAGGS